MKKCSKCLRTKSDNFFRNRKDKRSGSFYLNNTCRNCEAEIQKNYYDSKKQIPEFKKLNCERAKKYRVENSVVYRQRAKIKRQSPQYKQNRKKYILKNKEKIYHQESICKKKYHEKSRDYLTDVYVIGQIVQKTKLPRDVVPTELIEAKRAQIKLIRLLSGKQ